MQRPTRAPFGPRTPTKDAAVQTNNATFVTPPTLTPPPPVSFESTPIPWKGLPFEVAQWTFSSAELQEIVSQAIRLSARESFVRLLSPQALEVDMVREQDRLDHERLAAQAKWRFQVGRRTMLVQALNASAASAQDPAPLLAFVSQLAASLAASDALFASILHIADQQSQIALVQHQHWASALGIALRKLNSAYERQADELRRAQARILTLEDELEEAWREAEKMAIEFDHLPDPVADETATLGDVTIYSDLAVVLGVTATAVASKATLVTPPLDDARSIHSRRDAQSYVSRVSAARMRSRTASNASLRLPKALRSPDPVPPIPSASFLDMDALSVKPPEPEPEPEPEPPKSEPPKPEPTLPLPTPPHSAGLPTTHVPSIWVESDGGKSTRLNGLDRTHSLHIFSSLANRTPKKARRSNLVMSLTEGSSGLVQEDADPAGGGTTTLTASPTSTSSPMSLPTIAYFRGSGLGGGEGEGSQRALRPGSAGARLTGTGTGEPSTPRKSLVSRASSVILRRLSQAGMGRREPASPSNSRHRGGSGSGSGGSARGRAAVELGRECAMEEEEEGEVMLIGSPHADSFDV